MLATLVLSFPDPKSFRKQRIYQVITDRFAGGDDCNSKRNYCNGNLKSMAGKLDYIKNLGYTAIWISPTVQQAEGPQLQYKGYWPSDFYKTNPKQGSDQDLKDFVTEAHKRGLLVISDVNYNNVGQCKDGKVSCITTFPLDAYYHSNCNITDPANSTQLEKCRGLDGSPDLDQDHPYVLQELLDWTAWYQNEFNMTLETVVQKLSFLGFCEKSMFLKRVRQFQFIWTLCQDIRGILKLLKLGFLSYQSFFVIFTVFANLKFQFYNCDIINFPTPQYIEVYILYIFFMLKQFSIYIIKYYNLQYLQVYGVLNQNNYQIQLQCCVYYISKQLNTNMQTENEKHMCSNNYFTRFLYKIMSDLPARLELLYCQKL
ncbi:Alpha_amylase [Hexamita inflata]|uniref:Alpha amylase n=1 Tax=Hexamita inflata TaxID=28002 RepID=A0AA86RIZ4_9EUKA|nr:Alpha amylase [Hexamita inflata]